MGNRSYTHSDKVRSTDNSDRSKDTHNCDHKDKGKWLRLIKKEQVESIFHHLQGIDTDAILNPPLILFIHKV
jgi:hypothetical protein